MRKIATYVMLLCIVVQPANLYACRRCEGGRTYTVGGGDGICGVCEDTITYRIPGTCVPSPYRQDTCLEYIIIKETAREYTCDSPSDPILIIACEILGQIPVVGNCLADECKCPCVADGDPNYSGVAYGC